MKALVGAFNQEKALVGAFSVIVQLHRLIDLRHYSSPDVVEEEGGVDEHHMEEEDPPGEGHPEQVDVRPPAVSAGLLHIDTGVIHRHAEREDCVV